MSALEELLAMETEREERIHKISDLIPRMIYEESKRLSKELILKMRDGVFGFAEELAHDAGYETSYAAMRSVVYEKQDKLYYRILVLMEGEFWSYHLPYEIRNLLRELDFENGLDKDAATEELKVIEKEIRKRALNHAIEALEVDESYDDEESEDEEETEDVEDEDDEEEDEEEATLKDNWYFSSLCEKLSMALLRFCDAKQSKRLREYVDAFLNNLSTFKHGEEIEESFSFYIMQKFSVNGNQDHEALNIDLHSDEFIISKGGYVHGPYGGDSYTDWRMFFWPNGGMDLPIDERYELERYNEIIDSIDYSVNSKRAEFYIETPDEYSANPVGDDYDDEEDKEDL